MESLTSAISVQVDTKDKETANEILKNLGLNMSTFVNMAIKQLLYTNGLPFEVKNPTDNENMLNKKASIDTTVYNMPDLMQYINEK